MVFSLECLTLEIMTMIDIQRLLHQQHIPMVKTDKVQHISERYEIAMGAYSIRQCRKELFRTTTLKLIIFLGRVRL